MSATEAERSVTVRLFVYAPEEADLQQIVQIARSMDRGLDAFSVEVLTWPEARDITPGGFDVVVATFTKSAATRSWIGSAKRKWARCLGPLEGWRTVLNRQPSRTIPGGTKVAPVYEGLFERFGIKG